VGSVGGAEGGDDGRWVLPACWPVAQRIGQVAGNAPGAQIPRPERPYDALRPVPQPSCKPSTLLKMSNVAFEGCRLQLFDLGQGDAAATACMSKAVGVAMRAVVRGEVRFEMPHPQASQVFLATRRAAMRTGNIEGAELAASGSIQRLEGDAGVSHGRPPSARTGRQTGRPSARAACQAKAARPRACGCGRICRLIPGPRC
jgi:hypothetical protein